MSQLEKAPSEGKTEPTSYYSWDNYSWEIRDEGEGTSDRYRAIRANYDFSREALGHYQKHLSEALGNKSWEGNPCVVVFGSLARLEASLQSDLDYVILYPDNSPDETEVEEFRGRVKDELKSVELPDHLLTAEDDLKRLEAPNPKGVFKDEVSGNELLQDLGKQTESYRTLALRMLFVLESKALWGEAQFLEVRDRILAEYGSDVGRNPSKNYVLLINDLIRYFRSLCVNYHAQKCDEDEYGKWPIRNIKLRHSRVLMYCSLLFALGELSRFKHSLEGQKNQLLSEYVDHTPLQRLDRLYGEHQDDNAFHLLGHYNLFLEKMNNPTTRSSLQDLTYEDRYHNSDFADLKTNSDAFASELIRFLNARHGDWSDRYFEYIVL